MEKCINFIKLEKLLGGEVKPSSVIGSGYKNPKKSASEYLRKLITNAPGGNCKSVGGIIVSGNGRAFKTEAAACSSKAYTQLSKGLATFDGLVVSGFGVWPSFFGDGYEIYVDLDKP